MRSPILAKKRAQKGCKRVLQPSEHANKTSRTPKRHRCRLPPTTPEERATRGRLRRRSVRTPWRGAHMSPIPDMLTVAETARRLSRSPAFVRRLIHYGKLRAVRLSEHGHLLVYADSLCALLKVKRERQHSREYYLKRDDEILARMGLL